MGCCANFKNKFGQPSNLEELPAESSSTAPRGLSLRRASSSGFGSDISDEPPNRESKNRKLLKKNVSFSEAKDFNSQWDQENKPLEMPGWLSQSLQLRNVPADETSSGFGSVTS